MCTIYDSSITNTYFHILMGMSVFVIEVGVNRVESHNVSFTTGPRKTDAN